MVLPLAPHLPWTEWLDALDAPYHHKQSDPHPGVLDGLAGQAPQLEPHPGPELGEAVEDQAARFPPPRIGTVS